MTDLGTLAPTIAGGAMLAFAVATAVWFDRTSPKVEHLARVPASEPERPEEEAHGPFEYENPVVTGTMPHVTTRPFGALAKRIYFARASKDARGTDLTTPKTSASYAPPTKVRVESS